MGNSSSWNHHHGRHKAFGHITWSDSSPPFYISSDTVLVNWFVVFGRTGLWLLVLCASDWGAAPGSFLKKKRGCPWPYATGHATTTVPRPRRAPASLWGEPPLVGQLGPLPKTETPGREAPPACVAPRAHEGQAACNSSVLQSMDIWCQFFEFISAAIITI